MSETQQAIDLIEKKMERTKENMVALENSLTEAKAEYRRLEVARDILSGLNPGKAAAVNPTGRRQMSQEAKNRVSAAMVRRWEIRRAPKEEETKEPAPEPEPEPIPVETPAEVEAQRSKRKLRQMVAAPEGSGKPS